MIYTVLIDDMSIGTVDTELLEVGETIEIILNNENGLQIEKVGIVIEILEEREPWN